MSFRSGLDLCVPLRVQLLAGPTTQIMVAAVHLQLDRLPIDDLPTLEADQGGLETIGNQSMRLLFQPFRRYVMLVIDDAVDGLDLLEKAIEEALIVQNLLHHDPRTPCPWGRKNGRPHNLTPF